MITFQHLKTRTFRGINAYERFGQSIMNKYQFISKPYLGMLNLLFLDPNNESMDHNHSNLYNYMVQLRLQLDRHQINKEYNLFASRPFVYQLLEKILVKQSMHGSDLRSYRNYITQLQINSVGRQVADLQVPSNKVKLQLSGHPIQYNDRVSTITKAMARIVVNPVVSTERRLSRASIMDRQLTYHYRKPLIESIWMNRIASKASDKKLVPLVNELNRVTEHNQHIDRMNSVDRIILNHRILKMVYEYGKKHDVFEGDVDSHWLSLTLSNIHPQEQYGELHTNVSQDIIKATARIEANLLIDRKGLITNRNISELQKIAFVHNYRKSFIQDIWNDQITMSTKKRRHNNRVDHYDSFKLNWANYRMKSIHRATSSVLDYNLIIERMHDNQLVFTLLSSRGYSSELNRQQVSVRPIHDENYRNVLRMNARMLPKLDQYPISDILDIGSITATLEERNSVKTQHDKPVQLTFSSELVTASTEILEVIKSLATVVSRSTLQTNETTDALNHTIIQRVDAMNFRSQYHRQLVDSIWGTQPLAIEQSQIHNQSVQSANIFDQRVIEQRLRSHRLIIQYLVEHGIQAITPIGLSHPTSSIPSSIDGTEVVKSLATVVSRVSTEQLTALMKEVLVVNASASTRTIKKQYHRQLSDSIWLTRMDEKQRSSRTFTNTKPVELLFNTDTIQEAQRTSEVIKSLTKVVNRTEVLKINSNTTNNESTRIIDDEQVIISNARIIKKQYHRQLADSIWLAQLFDKQQSTQIHERMTSTNIFDQQFIEERLATNRRAVTKLIESGMKIDMPVQLFFTTDTIQEAQRTSEVIKSLTTVVNRTEVLNINSNTTNIEPTRLMDDAQVIISNARIIKKQYHRQLADSIWLVKLFDKQQSTQIHERMTSTNIFDLQFIEERLQSNRRAEAYLLVNHPVTLTVPELNTNEADFITDIVKSITKITNKNTFAVDERSAQSTATSIVNVINAAEIGSIKQENIKHITKQYKRHLAESIWHSKLVGAGIVNTRILGNVQAPSIEQAPYVLASIARMNQWMTNRTGRRVTQSIFDDQYVLEKVISNQRAIEFMIDYGVELRQPVELIAPSQQPTANETAIVDIVKSLTRIVTRNATESSMTHVTGKAMITQQYHRRLSDSVWISRIIELTQLHSHEQHLNSSISVTRRNKRILHRTILNVTTGIFDQRMIEERVNANRRALKYMMDNGTLNEKPVQLVTRSHPDTETELVQEVVKAVTKIEFGNSTMRTSINKLFMQQYKRQLTESVWIKQIHEYTRATTKKTTRKQSIVDERNNESLITDDYMQRLERTNKRITHQSLAANVTDLFNNHMVEQRLQHNRIAIHHLQELGITMNTPIEMLLPSQLKDQSVPVNEVVKAITYIAATLPSLRSVKLTNKVIPIEVLRQYRTQLTDSLAIQHQDEATIRTYRAKQHAAQLRASNPIMQILQQKASGSVFDSIVIDERAYRDLITTRRSNNVSNLSIEQRRDHLVNWLLPKQAPSEGLTSKAGIPELNRHTNHSRSIYRRLQLIRTNHHQLDSSTMESIRAYTSSLFTSTEIDYLNTVISGVHRVRKGNSISKHHNSTDTLMNTKITWLQGVVDHLVKSSTVVSNTSYENLTTENRKVMNKQIQTNFQHLFIVPEHLQPDRINQQHQTAVNQSIAFVHASPTTTLDARNDDLTYRIDKEASLDYLIPKPAIVQPEPAPEPTIKPVEFDVQVEQDKVNVNPLNHIDMNELVDKIYSEIERKMTFERQRRGF